MPALCSYASDTLNKVLSGELEPSWLAVLVAKCPEETADAVAKVVRSYADKCPSTLSREELIKIAYSQQLLPAQALTTGPNPNSQFSCIADLAKLNQILDEALASALSDGYKDSVAEFVLALSQRICDVVVTAGSISPIGAYLSSITKYAGQVLDSDKALLVSALLTSGDCAKAYLALLKNGKQVEPSSQPAKVAYYIYILDRTLPSDVTPLTRVERSKTVSQLCSELVKAGLAKPDYCKGISAEALFALLTYKLGADAVRKTYKVYLSKVAEELSTARLEVFERQQKASYKDGEWPTIAVLLSALNGVQYLSQLGLTDLKQRLTGDLQLVISATNYLRALQSRIDVKALKGLCSASVANADPEIVSALKSVCTAVRSLLKQKARRLVALYQLADCSSGVSPDTQKELLLGYGFSSLDDLKSLLTAVGYSEDQLCSLDVTSEKEALLKELLSKESTAGLCSKDPAFKKTTDEYLTEVLKSGRIQLLKSLNRKAVLACDGQEVQKALEAMKEEREQEQKQETAGGLSFMELVLYELLKDLLTPHL